MEEEGSRSGRGSARSSAATGTAQWAVPPSEDCLSTAPLPRARTRTTRKKARRSSDLAVGAHFVMVVVGLGAESRQQHVAHCGVIALAQGGAHVVLRIGEQARPHLAVGGHAQAVALAAEVARQRADEAHGSQRVGKLEIASRAPAQRFGRPCRAQLGQPRRTGAFVDDVEQLLGGDDILLAPAGAGVLTRIAHGHVLDEAHVQRPIDGELRELQKVLVKAAHGHGVHLHGIEPCGERRVDAGEGVLQTARARDLVELHRIQGVKRDVDPRKPRCLQIADHPGQKHPVGGHGDVLDTLNVRDGVHQLHHALAHQRLAAREANRADAEPGGHGHQPLDLLDAQDLVMGHRAHALLGHAVDAAEIAAIRQRYAQIIDSTTV